MDKKARENMKMLALVGFILTSAALIVSIWAGGILENEFTNPSFYRSTTQAVEVTPMPATNQTPGQDDAVDGEHGGRGGHGAGGLTPTPTIDWSIIEDDQ